MAGKNSKKTEEETLVDDDAQSTEPSEMDSDSDKSVDAPQELDDAHDLHHDDELAETSSLASKVLTGLTLMVVGGGVALWGGPKLAPHMPAGMAPVAEFFAPGQSGADDKIDALKAELTQKIETIPSADGAISAALADYDKTNQSNLQSIKDQLAATDSQEIESRLSKMETAMEGLGAQMETLNTQLADIDLSSGNVDEATAAKIASYAATIEGLKAQLSDISSKQGTLSQKIDEVTVTSTRKVEEAETKVAMANETASEKIANAQIRKGLSDLRVAIESGAPFDATLTSLSENGAKIPPALTQIGQSGVMTFADLNDGFSQAAHAALKADIRSSNQDGVGSKLTSFFKSQVTVRSLKPKDGDSTDAILSRVQGALDAEDLGTAITQAQSLPEAPKAALSGWLSAAQNRLGALSALDELVNSAQQ